jgi:hypothetical protein
MYPSIHCNLYKYGLRITTIQDIFKPVLDSSLQKVEIFISGIVLLHFEGQNHSDSALTHVK